MPVNSVNQQDRIAMWQLFDRYYSGINEHIFFEDFAAKDTAVLLWRNEQLAGFTSLRFSEVEQQRVLYSGDIVIDQSVRDIGTAYFFQQWAHAVWQQCDWWCYLASGARTYRIPHTFYKRVTPHPEATETLEEKALKDRLAQHAYGHGYDAHKGTVRLKHPYRLRDSQPDTRSKYPMDNFFKDLNPNWKQGEELVSLISLKPDNWNAAAMRMLNWKTRHA